MKTNQTKSSELYEMMKVLPQMNFADFRQKACETFGWSKVQWENRYYGRTRLTPAEKLVLSGMVAACINNEPKEATI